MPQEHHVLQCFKCDTFQVDIVKKSPKWSCKMCGEKQCVKEVYAKASAKDCRVIVQSLNQQRLTQPEFKQRVDPLGENVEDSANYSEGNIFQGEQ
ncbi:MRN complex-interacting protein [Tribolium madens]|uniref:MRN complex-interacting protein n=1 Tax=Tribolium madens TaxID=41895 RepID=UPI001CF73CC1|nr:MRN complex-interacting protein [Tribolium madens]